MQRKQGQTWSEALIEGVSSNSGQSTVVQIVGLSTVRGEFLQSLYMIRHEASMRQED